MKAKLNWVRLIEPQQLKLGHSGREETPIFADCAGCGADDAVIAGGSRAATGIGPSSGCRTGCSSRSSTAKRA